MAEALLRQHLAARGLSSRVSSTGLSFDGRPATEEAVEVLARQGLDLSAHSSRTLTVAQLEQADLVLAMERQHVREAYLLAPSVLGRTFTLREFVRRATATGPLAGDFHGWLVRVGLGRRASDLVGESSADDVADPFGSPLSVYEATAGQLDDLCGRAADLLTGRVPPPPAEPDPDPVGVGVGAASERARGGGRSRFWRR
jgi:protein-tyrosine-phosphatase